MPTGHVNIEDARKRHPTYLGFDPDVEYVIRSAMWDYNDITCGFVFRNGEAVAPAMRQSATEQQRWDRGARLQRIRDIRGTIRSYTDGRPNAGTREDYSYRIYVRGAEPDPENESLWQGQPDPRIGADTEDIVEERGDNPIIGRNFDPPEDTGEGERQPTVVGGPPARA